MSGLRKAGPYGCILCFCDFGLALRVVDGDDHDGRQGPQGHIRRPAASLEPCAAHKASPAAPDTDAVVQDDARAPRTTRWPPKSPQAGLLGQEEEEGPGGPTGQGRQGGQADRRRSVSAAQSRQPEDLQRRDAGGHRSTIVACRHIAAALNPDRMHDK